MKSEKLIELLNVTISDFLCKDIVNFRVTIDRMNYDIHISRRLKNAVEKYAQEKQMLQSQVIKMLIEECSGTDA